MAECTPNLRASYEAAETTPRSSRCPPTTTAFPFSDGSNNSSTETKKASISTWKIVLRNDCCIEEKAKVLARFYQCEALESSLTGFREDSTLRWADLRTVAEEVMPH